MLHEFLAANRGELMERCRSKMARRCADRLAGGPPMQEMMPFIDLLTRTLRLEATGEPALSQQPAALAASAARHGRDLLERGYPVEHLAYDYGDLFQAITELAIGYGKPIQIAEFRTLGRCVNNAIADAVTEYGCGHGTPLTMERRQQAMREWLRS